MSKRKQRTRNRLGSRNKVILKLWRKIVWEEDEEMITSQKYILGARGYRENSGFFLCIGMLAMQRAIYYSSNSTHKTQ